MSVTVTDYSTETGLRVRVECDTTGTTVNIPADEWHEFLADAKRGAFDDMAQQPRVPYVHWKDGHKYPGQE